MKLIENPKLAEKYQNLLLKNNHFNRAKVIHRSDLIYCPRKAFFRLKGYQETRPNAFAPLSIIGKVLHVLLEITEKKEVPYNQYQVKATIDMLTDKQFKIENEPIELKSTRGTVSLFNNQLMMGKTNPIKLEAWHNQLFQACLFTNKQTGHLFVLNVITGKLKVYTCILTKKDLKTVETNLKQTRNLIIKAVNSNDYHVLPISTWECATCGYTQCDQSPILRG